MVIQGVKTNMSSITKMMESIGKSTETLKSKAQAVEAEQ